MFDILITAAEKDYNKLIFVIRSIRKNIDGFDDIHVISPTNIINKIDGVKYSLDKDVVNFDFSQFKGNIAARTGWYKQQFIKLFQNVTKDNYLVIDSDVYINRKIDLFVDGHPCFLLGEDQDHFPYFEFTKKVLGFGRIYPHSFINEIMYFQRGLIQSMIEPWTEEGFFITSVDVLNKINHKTSSFSEYETYGNFVSKYYPGLYRFQFIKTASKALRKEWNSEELEQYILSFEDKNVDKLSMHTWI